MASAALEYAEPARAFSAATLRGEDGGTGTGIRRAGGAVEKGGNPARDKGDMQVVSEVGKEVGEDPFLAWSPQRHELNPEELCRVEDVHEQLMTGVGLGTALVDDGRCGCGVSDPYEDLDSRRACHCPEVQELGYRGQLALSGGAELGLGVEPGQREILGVRTVERAVEAPKPIRT
jgi:hypothetical protein